MSLFQNSVKTKCLKAFDKKAVGDAYVIFLEIESNEIGKIENHAFNYKNNQSNCKYMNKLY